MRYKKNDDLHHAYFTGTLRSFTNKQLSPLKQEVMFAAPYHTLKSYVQGKRAGIECTTWLDESGVEHYTIYARTFVDATQSDVQIPLLTLTSDEIDAIRHVQNVRPIQDALRVAIVTSRLTEGGTADG